MKKPKTTGRYVDAIAWIGANDEPMQTDVAEMQHLISVVLIADVFGRQPADVAADVVAYREKFMAEDGK